MMDIQPRLKGDQVIIEPLKEDHFEVLFGIASDEGIWEQHPAKDRYTESGFRRFFRESMESNGALVIREVSTGGIIGSTGFMVLDEIERVIEIGRTFLGRAFWGGRYNREVKRLMVDHVLERSGTIVLYTDRNNLRSQKALLKIGGRFIGDKSFGYHHRSSSNLTFVIDGRIEHCPQTAKNPKPK